jgi:CHAT domain-containing protein
MTSRRDRVMWWSVAVVIATGVAVFAWSRWSAARNPLEALIASAERQAHRPISARLTGFAHRPPPDTSRAAVQTGANEMLLRANALETFAALRRSDEPEDRYAAGIAALLVRGPAALENLRAAAAGAPTRPHYWSDLAAALHEHARESGDSYVLIDALGAADRALRLEPRLVEARFNRALILEEMRLRQHAASAWERYLESDATSPWAKEARLRLDELRETPPAGEWRDAARQFERALGGREEIIRPLVHRFPEETRRIGEATILAKWAEAFLAGNENDGSDWFADARAIGNALIARNGERLLSDAVAAIDGCDSPRCRRDLAAGHQAYDRARRLYAERRVAEALPRFEQAIALFQRGRSPMADVARYYAASCLEDQSDPAAMTHLERLLETVPSSYPALRAQLLWQIGTAHSRTGQMAEALASWSDATREFTSLGETVNANRTRALAAAACSLLGRVAEARRLRAEAFASLSAAGSAAALQPALELSARMEATDGNWDVAISLFELSLEPSFRINPRVQMSALLWSALTLHRGGEDGALPRLREARRVALQLEEGTFRDVALEDLLFAEAAVLRDEHPARAAALLDRYIEASTRRERTALLPESYLERARIARTLRQDAERFYRRALEEVEHRRRGSDERDMIDAWFATGTSAASELAGLLDEEGRTAEAFAVLERSRGRTLVRLAAAQEGDAESLLDAEAIRGRLDDRTALLSYLLLPDRAVAFTISRRDGLRRWTLDATAKRVEAEIARLRAAIDQHHDEDADAAAGALHAMLVEPLMPALHGARTWAIVLDPAMQEFPFVALRDRAGRRVIEHAAVVRIPSAALFVRRSNGRPEGEASGGTLVIGNPSFDRERFARLGFLPAAQLEAIAVGSEYPGAVVLTGDDATAERFLEGLRSSRIVHVATHAVDSRNDPMRSLLVMAPSSRHSGAVYAEEIVRNRNAAEVVVLAACRSAAGAEIGSDINSLALAFFAGGAGSVVGTLWDVDDREAATFSLRLHRHLLAGANPAEAVRLAQLDLLPNHPLRAWSAFNIISRASASARPSAQTGG